EVLADYDSRSANLQELILNRAWKSPTTSLASTLLGHPMSQCSSIAAWFASIGLLGIVARKSALRWNTRLPPGRSLAAWHHLLDGVPNSLCARACVTRNNFSKPEKSRLL